MRDALAVLVLLVVPRLGARSTAHVAARGSQPPEPVVGIGYPRATDRTKTRPGHEALHVVAVVHAVAGHPTGRGRHGLHAHAVERIVGVLDLAAVALAEQSPVADGVVA